MDIHVALESSTLFVLLGILWKGSVLTQRVEMMWKVFASEHGLDPKGK